MFDPVNDFNYVGTGLALDVENDGGRVVHPRREFQVLGVLDHVGNIGQINRCAAFVGDDDGTILGSRLQLIICIDCVRASGAIETSLGLIDVGGTDGGAYLVEADAGRGQCFRVDLHPHRGTLATRKRHQPDAWYLRYFLRNARVHQVLHTWHRHCFRRDANGQDRCVGRVHFAIGRWRGQIGRQQIAPRVDGCLHLLFGDIERKRQFELQRDDRRATGAGRRHLLQARHLSKLALQWRGDAGSHDVGTGTRIKGDDLNGRVIDFRQRRERQLLIGKKTGEQDCDHQ